MNESLTILCGDALEQLKKLPDESVQCCVTSPPYWGLRDYKVAGQLGMEKTPQLYVAALTAICAEVKRVLKPDGTFWLNLGDSYAGSGRGLNGSGKPSDKKGAKQGTNEGTNEGTCIGQFSKIETDCKPKDLIGIPWRGAFALQAAGWYLRSDIIWSKPNPMPESVTDRPTRSHEYIFLLTKSPKYFYDADAIKEPALFESELRAQRGIGENHKNVNGAPGQPPHSIAAPRKNCRKDKQRGHSRRHDGFNSRWDDMEKTEQCSGMRNKRDVWTVSPAQYSEAHFATFPPELIKPCVLAGSRAGDTILDPFGGSGTTGEVALELGRKAILIELNPDYIELIKQRTNITPGLALK